MTLFDLDAVIEREKVKPAGELSANDYYPSLGSQYTGNTQTYKDYESAVNDAKKELEEANKQAEYIDTIIGILAGDVEYTEPALDKIRDQVITVVNSVGLDQSNYDIKSLEITELENIKTDIRESFAPKYDFYKALNEEQNVQTVAALVLNKDKPEVISQLIQSPETAENVVTSSDTQAAPSPQAETLERGLEGLAQARETGKVFDDQGGAAIISEEMAKGDDAFAGFAGFLGQSVPGTKGTVPAEEESTDDQLGSSGGGGSNAARMMAEREADRDEIYSLLQEQFGGASYFFRQHATNMLIGVTADGTIVSYDDESAESQIGLMDYIVNNGITSMTRVKGLLQKTEWWQTTDVARRTYDVMWGEMSDPERKEFLEPTTDALTKEAQFLGFDLNEEDAFSLAQTLAQNGDSEDTEAIREMIIGQLANYEITNEFSDFSAGRDALEQLAYKYYVPQTEDTAQDWAEKIYTGEATQTEYEQYLKATAVSRFPTLDKVINQMGITPDQYFSPYKYQIEQMLGRQVDMLDEFSDVIEYIPDAGTNARPMTLSEVRNFVRALPEWQQTDDAKDQARALSFSIGQTFGEVA